MVYGNYLSFNLYLIAARQMWEAPTGRDETRRGETRWNETRRDETVARRNRTGRDETGRDGTRRGEIRREVTRGDTTRKENEKVIREETGICRCAHEIASTRQNKSHENVISRDYHNKKTLDEHGWWRATAPLLTHSIPMHGGTSLKRGASRGPTIFGTSDTERDDTRLRDTPLHERHQVWLFYKIRIKKTQRKIHY